MKLFSKLLVPKDQDGEHKTFHRKGWSATMEEKVATGKR